MRRHVSVSFVAQTFTTALITSEIAEQREKEANDDQSLTSVQPEVWNAYRMKTCPPNVGFIFVVYFPPVIVILLLKKQ